LTASQWEVILLDTEIACPNFIDTVLKGIAEENIEA